MSLIKSSNPALTTKRFKEQTIYDANTEIMTVQGTINKSILMLLLLIGTATFTWSKFFNGEDTSLYIGIGIIGGLITALITIFGKPSWSPITAPLYALLEGLALGGISAYFEVAYSGIVLSTVGLTITVFFSMLFIYKAGLIKPTNKFYAVMGGAISGILLFVIIRFVLSMLGVNIAFLSGGLIGIGISLVIVIVAALSLIIDFDQIEKNAALNVPQYMEWYSAFGLMITLVWLYLELLRLLSYFRD